MDITSGNVNVNIKMIRIKTREALEQAEKEYRHIKESIEYIPWAQNTSYTEIAENVISDKYGPWSHDLYLSKTIHKTTIGIRNACIKANEYLEQLKQTNPIDVLSISARMENNKIALVVLVRAYRPEYTFVGFFDYIGEKPVEVIEEYKPSIGALVIPDEIKNFSYTEKQISEHDKKFNDQCKVLEKCSKEHPFLNSIEEYVPEKMPSPEDTTDLIYDLKTNDMKLETRTPYEQFNQVFKEVMTYVSGVEYYHYVTVMRGEEETEEQFMSFLEQYIIDTYIKPGHFPQEDLPALMGKLYRSLFQLYVIQDLIDDPNVTDINITAPDSIRARVYGKTYMSNINFIDKNDYLRFINGIAVRNNILQSVPEQTFTDTNDENYILRFSITAAYVNSVEWPYLHIRKVSRKKLLGKDLLEAGMFDKKVMDYLLDCGKTSRGVVFAGRPGSGKTVCLNWFLEEAYEQSADILVIQENDELFCYRKGVKFQHVVNYSNEGNPVNLEQLGQLALGAGANVFVIGEAKGAEICSAITLSNSGCRTAITIHSPSSTETLDKMADLAMRGYATDYTQAMRMLKSFQTIVYLEDFSVKEISEITGFNEETKQMEYRYIYRK